MAGLLGIMKHKDILDLCNEAGLDAHANRIDDVKNLSKRLAEFRAFQQRGLNLSPPKNIFHGVAQKGRHA
jgi:hypothetical protein